MAPDLVALVTTMAACLPVCPLRGQGAIREGILQEQVMLLSGLVSRDISGRQGRGGSCRRFSYPWYRGGRGGRGQNTKLALQIDVGRDRVHVIDVLKVGRR